MLEECKWVGQINEWMRNSIECPNENECIEWRMNGITNGTDLSNEWGSENEIVNRMIKCIVSTTMYNVGMYSNVGM